MSEASKRTIEWREQKRQEGYQPVTIWIPAKIKNAMMNLGFQRHQDLGELLIEAFQAWSPAKSVKTAAAVDTRQVEALIERKIAEALASHTPTPAAPPPPRAPLPEGKKQCGKGHDPYPANKAECPQCVRDRKRAARKRKADQRRGEVPA